MDKNQKIVREDSEYMVPTWYPGAHVGAILLLCLIMGINTYCLSLFTRSK